MRFSTLTLFAVIVLAGIAGCDSKPAASETQQAGQTQPFRLYSAAFGDSTKPAIVFLHGGPGYNCAAFEIATAQPLADKGYYVVVYEQRGCGRSVPAPNSAYTFSEALQDLEEIYQRHHIRNAALIGHSWGGAVAVKFAEKYPEKISRLIFCDAPMDYQQTFRAMRANSRKAMEGQPALDTIASQIAKLDTASLDYALMCFQLGMQSGLYSPKRQNLEAIRLQTKMMQSPKAAYMMRMTEEPVTGFYKSEHYTTLNLTNDFKKVAQSLPVFGVYGTEDGLFDTATLDAIGKAIGPGRLVRIPGASHNVFTDQPTEFLNTIVKFMQDGR